MNQSTKPSTEPIYAEAIVRGICQLIDEERADQSLSIEVLAAEAGISAYSLQRILSGAAPLTIEVWVRVCRVLGVTMSEFTRRYESVGLFQPMPRPKPLRDGTLRQVSRAEMRARYALTVSGAAALDASGVPVVG